MILLSAIATSLDSFILGFLAKKEGVRFKFETLIYFWLFSFGAFLLCQFFLQFIPSLHTKWLKFCLFFIFGCLSLKPQENSYHQKKMFGILFMNSIDGILISSTFLANYSFVFISLLFSFTSVFFLYLGNTFGQEKKSFWQTPFLYFLLAFLSLF